METTPVIELGIMLSLAELRLEPRAGETIFLTRLNPGLPLHDPGRWCVLTVE